MKSISRRYLLFLVFVILLPAGAQADSAVEPKINQFASDASGSLKPFIIAGELSLLANGSKGWNEATQGAKAVTVACLATEVLKRLTRERRPNGKDDLSFPSGHAATAFAMAGVLDTYKPGYKILGYAAATAISWSRVELRAHHWHDVAVGALIGVIAARKLVHSDHLTTSGSGLGLQFSW